MRGILNLRTVAALRRDRRGNFAIITGIISVVLMMSAGFAVNIAQVVMTRSNLLNALDSAITSTARDLTTGVIAPQDARSSVEAFLNANGGTGFASVNNITLDSLNVDQTAKTVSAQASVKIALLFPFFSTSDAQDIVVNSAAAYTDKDVEVAMMLDTTGSMAGQKIADLQTAAKNAVTTLLGDGTTPSKRVRVAIIPYAAAVNVGSRMANEAVYDEMNAPAPDLPPPYNKPTGVSATPLIDNCATERKLPDGTADFSDDGPYTSMPWPPDTRYSYYKKVNRDDRLTRPACPPAAMIPLTNNASQLTSEISTFKAGGTTAGNIGVQWTYYMLSPNWRSAISNAGLGSGPADYDKTGQKVGKIAILMTDGEFNTAYAGVPRSARVTNQAAVSSSNAEALCTAMKSKGIEIFTIGFMLDEPGARTTLSNCASPDTNPNVKHFYDAADGAALAEAFASITRDIQHLVLTR